MIISYWLDWAEFSTIIVIASLTFLLFGYYQDVICRKDNRLYVNLHSKESFDRKTID